MSSYLVTFVVPGCQLRRGKLKPEMTGLLLHASADPGPHRAYFVCAQPLVFRPGRWAIGQTHGSVRSMFRKALVRYRVAPLRRPTSRDVVQLLPVQESQGRVSAGV